MLIFISTAITYIKTDCQPVGGLPFLFTCSKYIFPNLGKYPTVHCVNSYCTLWRSLDCSLWTVHSEFIHCPMHCNVLYGHSAVDTFHSVIQWSQLWKNLSILGYRTLTQHTALCFRSIVALHSFRLRLCSVKCIVHCTLNAAWCRIGQQCF